MSIANPVFKVITSGAPSITGTVYLHQNEWSHILRNHSPIEIDHVVQAIEQPIAIYQDHLRSSGILIVGLGVDISTGHPIRVAVKRLSHASFISTAWYSSAPFKGSLLWKQGDKP